MPAACKGGGNVQTPPWTANATPTISRATRSEEACTSAGMPLIGLIGHFICFSVAVVTYIRYTFACPFAR
ncbi:unnamed protein product, partial [Iphiclides podalirius]